VNPSSHLGITRELRGHHMALNAGKRDGLDLILQSEKKEDWFLVEAFSALIGLVSASLFPAISHCQVFIIVSWDERY